MATPHQVTINRVIEASAVVELLCSVALVGDPRRRRGCLGVMLPVAVVVVAIMLHGLRACAWDAHGVVCAMSRTCAAEGGPRALTRLRRPASPRCRRRYRATRRGGGAPSGRWASTTSLRSRHADAAPRGAPARSEDRVARTNTSGGHPRLPAPSGAGLGKRGAPQRTWVGSRAWRALPKR